ncbi:MAG: hypothetical protein ACR2LS_11235 [Thermomicrobiales bacterium]
MVVAVAVAAGVDVAGGGVAVGRGVGEGVIVGRGVGGGVIVGRGVGDGEGVGVTVGGTAVGVGDGVEVATCKLSGTDGND